MPAADFVTVPDELLHVAVTIEDYLEDQGYLFEREKPQIGFPFTPTFVAKRGHETLIIEISSLLDENRVERWLRYCRSLSIDTRLCAVLVPDAAHGAAAINYCQKNRIGLWTLGNDAVIEIQPPLDLAVHVELPPLKEISVRVRPYVAEPFKKLGRGEWRDGLSDIYNAIEELAREYLKDGIDRTRIVSVSRTGKILTKEKVDSLTIGQLARAFSEIQNQNQQDSLIGNTLAMINPTRVQLTHKRRQVAAEAKIRLDVGKHVYAAIGCLEDLSR